MAAAARVALLLLPLLGKADATHADPGADFSGLGQVPGISQGSRALGISSDGSTIVGDCEGASGCPEAWRWTNATGLVALGFLPGATDSAAAAASADGTFIVGASGDDGFRWSSVSGMEPIVVPLPGTTWISAVSADGSTSVGAHWDLTTYDGAAIRWTPSGGTELLLIGSIEDQVAFSDVSADGAILLGNGGDPYDQYPFLWTDTGGACSDPGDPHLQRLLELRPRDVE